MHIYFDKIYFVELKNGFTFVVYILNIFSKCTHHVNIESDRKYNFEMLLNIQTYRYNTKKKIFYRKKTFATAIFLW